MNLRRIELCEAASNTIEYTVCCTLESLLKARVYFDIFVFSGCKPIGVDIRKEELSVI